MSSLVSSDDAITEPYSDLLAISLILTGFLLFLVLVGGAYATYASKTFAMEHCSDVNFLAQKLKGELAFSTREDLLDVEKLDCYQADAEELLDSWNHRFGIQITVTAGDRIWIIGDTPDLWVIRSSASLPVSVRVNPAQNVDGSLKVTLWER